MQIAALMTSKGAARRRFPVRPRPGQVVYHNGVAWMWFPPDLFDSRQLGDLDHDGLGFWGALIGAVTGLAPLFMGGGKKKTDQAIAEQQQQIQALQQQLDEERNRPKGAEAIFNKKTIPLISLLVFGYLVLR